MKRFWLSILIVFVLSSSAFCEEEPSVKIVKPGPNEMLSNPVEVCMEIKGLILEPAKNGVSEGKGHHHILFSSLPKDLSQPIGRKQGIHMSDGKECTTVNLVPGIHTVLTLFSYGDHVPYNPPITDKVIFSVK